MAAAAPESGCQLVTVLVVAPPETNRGSAVRTSQARRLALSLVWLMATLAVAVFLVKHILVVAQPPPHDVNDVPPVRRDNWDSTPWGWVSTPGARVSWGKLTSNPLRWSWLLDHL